MPDFFLQSSHPEQEVIENVWNFLRRLGQGTHEFTAGQLARRLPSRTSDMAVGSALNLLARAGHVALPSQTGQSGIEVLDSSLPRQLRVDWRELNARRQFEEQKLKQVIYYATTNRCRSHDILRYFGSRVGSDYRCGHCDNCVEPAPYASAAAAPRRRRGGVVVGSAVKAPPSDRQQTSESFKTIARKLFACVARCREREAAVTVVRILAGSKSRQLADRDLDKLSTYGLLSYLQQKTIGGVIDAMLEGGLLGVKRGSLCLTPEAVAIMKGEGELPDGVKDRMALFLEPPDADEVSSEAVQAHTRAQAAAHRSAADTSVSATVSITLEMMRQGLDVEQIARQRNVKTTTIVNHVIKAAEEQQADIDFSAYLDGALLPVIHTVAEKEDWREGLRQFREEVLKLYPGSRIKYDILKMNIAYLIQKGELE
ncbi:MAG: hypothetical protein CMH57_12550 [Myxococcales bacterium]|nr:hypothetical protein [Myxococcales bacterium]